MSDRSGVAYPSLKWLQLRARCGEILFRRRRIDDGEIVEVTAPWPDRMMMVGIVSQASCVEFIPVEGGDLVSIDVDNGWALYRIEAEHDDVHIGRLIGSSFRQPAKSAP